MSQQLILITGLMCDAAVWEPVLPHLQANAADVVIPDHGMANSITLMATQILDRAAPRFALAGHSMGGRVAMEMLRLAPERVMRIALLDTGHTPLPQGDAAALERSKRMALLKIAREQGVRAMAAQWAQGMVHPDRLQDADLMASIIAMFDRKSADVFAAQIEALLGRPDAAPVLRSCRVPALLACGAQDSWSPVSQHQAMQALLPSAELEVIEDAGHMCPMERPRELATVLNHWLAT